MYLVQEIPIIQNKLAFFVGSSQNGISEKDSSKKINQTNDERQ